MEMGLKEDAVAFLVEKMRIDDNMRWGGVVVVISLGCYGDLGVGFFAPWRR